MAMVLARQAASTPAVQQMAMELLAEGIQHITHKSRNRKANKQKKQMQKQRNDQLVVYRPPKLNNRAPVAINTRARTRRAKISGMSGGVVIKHREYIGEVNGSVTFDATSYTVQPGMASSFPWLSGIANNFEKYRIRNLRIEYVNVSATSERGRITLAYDKDPLDDDPVSKVDLFAYEGAQEGSVWMPTGLNIPCKNNELFTRNGTVPNTDLKTYDYGKIIVGASNTADTAVIGELFLSYDIELITPQPVKCPSVYAISAGSITAPFDNTTTNGSFPCTFDGDTITFLAPGTFLVSAMMSNGSGLTDTTRGGTATRSSTVLITAESAKVTTTQEVRALAGQTLTLQGVGTSSASCYTWVTMSGGQTV